MTMIQQDETQDYKQFVTTRRTLPASGDDMADFVWFNMWQRRLWPYRELLAEHVSHANQKGHELCAAGPPSFFGRRVGRGFGAFCEKGR